MNMNKTTDAKPMKLWISGNIRRMGEPNPDGTVPFYYGATVYFDTLDELGVWLNENPNDGRSGLAYWSCANCERPDGGRLCDACNAEAAYPTQVDYDIIYAKPFTMYEVNGRQYTITPPMSVGDCMYQQDKQYIEARLSEGVLNYESNRNPLMEKHHSKQK